MLVFRVATVGRGAEWTVAVPAQPRNRYTCLGVIYATRDRESTFRPAALKV